MSVTEAPKATRLEELRATLSQQVARRDEIHAFLAGSADRESRLLATHYTTSLSPPGATSATGTERRKRRDQTAELERLNPSIASLAALIADEEAKQKEVTLAEIQAELTEKQDAVRATYRACGVKFAELNDAFKTYVDSVTELDEFRAANQWRVGSTDEADRWLAYTAHLVVQPVPGDLGMLCADLAEIMLDPGNNGWRDRNDGNSAARAYDEMDEMRRLTPDLRPQEHRLTLVRNQHVRYSRGGGGTLRTDGGYEA